MALTANRSLKWGVCDDQEAYNVLTNVHIYQGSFVGWSGAAARPLVAGDIFLGVAITEENNTLNALGTGVGATGDKIVRVQKEGVIYSVAVTGAAAATDQHKAVYASDDGTLTLTAGSNSYVGKVSKYISTGIADVEFSVGTTIGSITGLTDSTGGTANNTLADGLTATALTEAAGAIGGTNNGDLPDLTATAAALTEGTGAIGGTNDGDLPSLTATAAAIAGTLTGATDGTMEDVAAIALATGNTYTDAAVNGAVNTAITTVNLELKELQVMINNLVTDNVALRAAIREVATGHNEIVTDNVALRAAIREVAVMTNTQTTDLTTQNSNDADLAAKINAILNTAV